jgi:hypothetical protein
VTTVCADPALTTAFGLTECTEQSVIVETLNTATKADRTSLQEVLKIKCILGESLAAAQFDMQLLVEQKGTNETPGTTDDNPLLVGMRSVIFHAVSNSQVSNLRDDTMVLLT